jgi:uncharacterized membrane protein YgaE (UPF0421/DUF939 family)
MATKQLRKKITKNNKLYKYLKKTNSVFDQENSKHDRKLALNLKVGAH